ncbi:hypothetical protein M2132_000192 [Dysgonomonas sp. PH5-45]|nr:hypothetical protein [Dysgonomonas sp. PH5-45]
MKSVKSASFLLRGYVNANVFFYIATLRIAILLGKYTNNFRLGLMNAP